VRKYLCKHKILDQGNDLTSNDISQGNRSHTSMSKVIYQTMWNGAHPYLVEITANGKNVKVLREREWGLKIGVEDEPQREYNSDESEPNSSDDDPEEYRRFKYNQKPLLNLEDVDEIFIGQDTLRKTDKVPPENSEYDYNDTFDYIGYQEKAKMSERQRENHRKQTDGNSILVCVNRQSHQYIWIGKRVKEFTALSPIVGFHSRVLGAFVPYPYAYDEDDNNYLFEEDVILPSKSWGITGTPYEDYYTSRSSSELKLKHIQPLNSKSL
jgi:hypothetical protein